jgi:hypothetical protein
MWVLVVLGTLVLAGLSVAVGWALRRRISRSPERDRLESESGRLSRLDRYRVMRAVSRGRAVRDPRLARAAVARSHYVRRFGRQVVGGRAIKFFTVFAVLWLAYGVVRLVLADGWSDRIVGIGAVGGSLGLLSTRWQHTFYGRRAERAEALNAPLVR